MNEIFVARKALEASLIISAEATSVRTIGAAERLVERGDAVGEALGLLGRADDDPVGVHEVVDRGALLEELRVRDVAEVVAAAADRAAGADRHGALHDDRVLARVAELLDDRSTRERSASPE